MDIENAQIPDGLDREIIKESMGDELPPKLGACSSHILLAACRKDEFAREQANKGRFTTALLRKLAEVDLKTTTYPQLMDKLPRLPK